MLLVEDEPALLEVSAKMIEMLGYKVIEATSPEEAIGFARTEKNEIHLLMTDVIMPGMNGRELGREITSLRPHIKCLFMSGYTSDVIGHHGVLDEGVHFLQKPFSAQNLSEKIHRALEHERAGGDDVAQ